MKKVLAVLTLSLLFSCNNSETENDEDTMKDTANDVAQSVQQQAEDDAAAATVGAMAVKNSK